MRKILVSNMVSADGFFAGPDGEIDWHVVDNEFNDYAIDMLNSADTLIFGCTTYDLMAGYWPMPDAIKNDPLVAGKMNTLPKIVFSQSLDKADWNNTRVLQEINKDDILRLKQQPGKDMVILGSGTIVQQFASLGLIDEYRLIVAPVVLGQGKPLFKEKIKFRLLKSKTLACGDVILCYQPLS
jgi:dihydrofolate reductase